MDDIQLRKALAKLQSFADELPKGDIEEKYVQIYHSLLADIQKETGQDLAYFRIPTGEVRDQDRGGYTDDYGEWVSVRSSRNFCDREMFMINLKGAINFINSFAAERGQRSIGFTQKS